MWEWTLQFWHVCDYCKLQGGKMMLKQEADWGRIYMNIYINAIKVNILAHSMTHIIRSKPIISISQQNRKRNHFILMATDSTF